MKQSISGGGHGHRHGGGWRILKEDELEVVEILLSLPKLIAKSEFLSRYSFTWGRKKKRSVLVFKSESSPLTHRKIDVKLTAAADDDDADKKSPSTPLCYLPSASGSDGAADKPKQLKKNLKRKATYDLMEKYTAMQQENEILIKKIKAMETLRRELNAQNMDLKGKRQEVNYSKNIEDFRLWTNPLTMNLDQQRYHRHHQQITIFAPPQQQHCQQFMVDPNNGKLVAMACSSNSNNGGRFGLFNQIDPRVKIHGETQTFDFMAASSSSSSSQPLDQSKYMVMDNDLRVRTAAAAARRRRIIRMKENKNSLLAMKLSRGCR